MRLRIGSASGRYWVEGRFFLRWRRLPSISHYLEYPAIRFWPKYICFFDTYEKARDLAAAYSMRFPCKAVYVYPNDLSYDVDERSIKS